MATKIAVINKLRPKIKRKGMLSQERMIDHMAGRTGLTRGQVGLVVDELQNVVLHYCRTGQSVKFERLGYYFPEIDLDGALRICHAVAPRLKKDMNNNEFWEGDVINAGNVGLTPDELVALWNEDHPDDLVV